VREFFADKAMCNEMKQQIQSFVEHWLPHFINDNRNYITVGIGCTGGQHRSVYLTSLLQQYFRNHENIQTIKTDGDDEEEAMAAVTNLINNYFDEQE